MPNNHHLLIWPLVLAAVWVVSVPDAVAQSGKIEFSELPPPPSEIAELLKQANVRFCYGPQEKPSSMTMPNGRRLGALTIYEMKYNFRTQSRLQRRSNRQFMATTIRPGTVRLKVSHIVWFRERPDTETFWSDWLVLHELDHVRISSDPTHENLFKKLLRESVVSNQSATEQVQEAFEKVTSLVDIRYRELDRLTDHGMMDLPKEGLLGKMLSPSR